MDELEKDAAITLIDEIGDKHPTPYIIENRLFEIFKNPAKIVILTANAKKKGNRELVEKIYHSKKAKIINMDSYKSHDEIKN